MCSEKIAEAHELPDLVHCLWWLGISDSFQFVCSRENALWGKPVPQVADIVSTKLAFLEVDLEICISESVEEFVQLKSMLFMSFGVE